MTNSNFLIGGDFNAKNVAWNCPVNNSAGRALQQLIDGEDLLIHFPDSPTHFPQNGNRPSTIDLILTRGFPSPSTLTTDDSFTSDHVPVLYPLNLNVERLPVTGSFIKDFSRADWEGYRTFIDSNVGNSTGLDLPDVTEEMIDDSVTKLIQVMLEADQDFIPLKRKSSNSMILSDEIKALITLRRTKIRKYKRTLELTLKKDIKSLTETITFKMKRQVNESFSKSVGDIDKNPGAHRKKLWRIGKNFKNRPKQIPALTDNGVTLITKEEKCNAFANHFHQIHENTDTKLHSDVTSKKVKTSMKRIKEAHIESESLPMISVIRILAVISSLKTRKAPGLDSITNRHLKQLPISAVEFLTSILNASLQIGYFPNAWKKA